MQAQSTLTNAEKRTCCSCLHTQDFHRRYVLVLVPILFFTLTVFDTSVYTLIKRFTDSRVGTISVSSGETVNGPLATYFQRECEVKSKINDAFVNNTQYIEKTVYKSDSTNDLGYGFLCSVKYLFQIMISPKAGAVTQKRGSDIALILGLCFIFLSSTIFAYGDTYFLLFFGRAIEGIGCGFQEISSLSLLALVLKNKPDIYFGFGAVIFFSTMSFMYGFHFVNFMYTEFGNTESFLFHSSFLLLIALSVVIVKPGNYTQITHNNIIDDYNSDANFSAPIWFLLMDSQVIYGATVVFFSSIIPSLLAQNMAKRLLTSSEIFVLLETLDWHSLLLICSTLLSIILSINIALRFVKYQWVLIGVGLILCGFCTCLIPLVSIKWHLVLILCGIIFGLNMIYVILLPTFANLVESRYLCAYGRIYALSNMCYSICFALSPLVFKSLLGLLGFDVFIYVTGCSLVLCSFFAVAMRSVYETESYETNLHPLHFLSERSILLEDPPEPQYFACVVQDNNTVLLSRVP